MPFKDKEKKRQWNAEWARRNPDYTRKKDRDWYWRNRDLKMKRCAEFRARNPDYAKKKSAEWRKRDKNPERTKKIKADWKRRNAPRNREHARRYRVARGSENLASHYEKIIAEAVRCAYCRCKLSGEKHVDHIVPLSRGGEHTKENLVVTCAHCNLSKSTKTPEEFAAYSGRLFL